MLYRDVRFTLRQGITPGAWIITLHPEDGKDVTQVFSGSRKQAEKTAHGMIERLLKRAPSARQE